MRGYQTVASNVDVGSGIMGGSEVIGHFPSLAHCHNPGGAPVAASIAMRRHSETLAQSIRAPESDALPGLQKCWEHELASVTSSGTHDEGTLGSISLARRRSARSWVSSGRGAADASGRPSCSRLTRRLPRIHENRDSAVASQDTLLKTGAVLVQCPINELESRAGPPNRVNCCEHRRIGCSTVCVREPSKVGLRRLLGLCRDRLAITEA